MLSKKLLTVIFICLPIGTLCAERTTSYIEAAEPGKIKVKDLQFKGQNKLPTVDKGTRMLKASKASKGCEEMTFYANRKQVQSVITFTDTGFLISGIQLYKDKKMRKFAGFYSESGVDVGGFTFLVNGIYTILDQDGFFFSPISVSYGIGTGEVDHAVTGGSNEYACAGGQETLRFNGRNLFTDTITVCQTCPLPVTEF